MKESTEDLKERFWSLTPNGDADSFRELLEIMPTQDAAEAFEELEDEDQTALLKRLTSDDFEDMLPHLPAPLVDIILQHFPQSDQREALEEMWDDELADFLQDVPEENRERYINLLDKETKETAEELLRYPETTAGGRMTMAYATIRKDMSLQAAIESLSEQKEETEILSRIYVVDDQQHIVGKVRLRDLTFNAHDLKVSDIMASELIAVEANADQEEAANMMLKYDMVTLPVVDSDSRLIGVITHDDAMEILQEESTEDLERQSGIAGPQDETNYLETSVLSHFRKRFVWVLGLAFLAIVSGYVIFSFENVLNEWFMLALYMPMVVAAGGNTGAQAATTIIRAMSLGEFEPREFLGAVWKELRIGLCIGTLLGIFVALATPLVMMIMPEQGAAPMDTGKLALIVAISLTVQVTTSTILGAALPILARALKQDPAVVASPAITTVVDATGLIIYFGLAKVILA
ncbi:MAG: magnesium transporter [Verrucomicrobiales bacterium]|jgi:magnesium transporter